MQRMSMSAGNHNNNNSRAGVYDGKIAGLYDLEETLGSGHFAVVKLARHVFTGEKVAVKVIDKTKLDEVSRAHLFQEVRCMKLVQHPNVVRLYEVIDTQTKLYLILELGDGGDLYDYIMRHEGGLSENLARSYFRQIVKAISYCHQLHVVHRDLKPENVVFFEKIGVVKLTDFGFSNKFCPGQKLETSCGSLAYSAPEILLGDSYDAPAVDIWSLGVILFMLVCGHPPFQEANDSETLTMIMDCKYTMPPHVSDECRSLISTMLVRQPEKRATLHDIAKNAWLMEGVTELPEYLPLVSREQVSDSDHTLIIQKMINGNIATKEEILEALDRNEYNHITATYFLLAERKLRAQRQEQAQSRKPELKLPVLGNVLSRNHQLNDHTSLKPDHCLLVPGGNTQSLLSVPRTPGADGQTGRIRKCSIVQEEEDDEDEVHGSGREDLTSPLNRRGSRSEGRINLAIQDRLAAESDRIKKQQELSGGGGAPKTTITTKGLNSLGGMTHVRSDMDATKEKLGAAGTGLYRKKAEFRPRTAGVLGAAKYKPMLSILPIDGRSNSVDKYCGMKSIKDLESVNTKFITDSSTISIPLTGQTPTVIVDPMPKYKTMPSPTRGSVDNCLNDDDDEVRKCGEADRNGDNGESVTTYSVTTTTNVTTHRRAKFHKARTASCSSSDASDDDSENRKKRAHKIVDGALKPLPQRRDSHDDSSDSQDAAGSGNTANSCGGGKLTIRISSSSTQDTSGQKNSTGGGGTTNNDSGSRKNNQQLDFRRHRTGRRRPGETRLRESQSLNRITEVQESEASSAVAPLASPIPVSPISVDAPEIVSNPPFPRTKAKGLSARILQTFKKHDTSHNNNNNNNNNNNLHNNNNNSNQHHHYRSKHEPLIQDDPQSTHSEDLEMVLGVELAKAFKASEAKNAKAAAPTKKIKILGRYFHVHRKIYFPLSGLFQRGRLYKAQSCSALSRDKINPSTTNSQLNNHRQARHSALFSDKGRLIRNCLGTRLLGSDGDINDNGKSTAGNAPPVIFAMTDTEVGAEKPLVVQETSTSSICGRC